MSSLRRYGNCFSGQTETIRTAAWSNTMADGPASGARARRTVPGRGRGRLPAAGRYVQGPGVRTDRADDPGSVAGGRSRAGRLPAHPSRLALFSGRGAALDLDLPHRRQRLRAGAEPATKADV